MKKKSLMIILAIALALVLILGGTIITSYNGLVDKQAAVEKFTSNIDADLQRRNDLIPNLVSTVKGYASHEKEVFTAVSDARAKLAGAGNDMQKKAEASDQLTTALRGFSMIVERYPELKADKNFSDLQSQIEGSENRIAVSRKDYNNAVEQYNRATKRFPTNIIAGMFGFDEAQSFKASDNAQKVPDVSFEK